MEIVIGVVSAVVVLASFAGGFLLGIKFEKSTSKKPELKELTEEERIKFEDEQNAFRNLLGYNAEMAYGIKPFPRT